jgi:membrane protein involved in colicin uptake
MLPSAEATRRSHRLQDRNFGTPERDEPLEERAHGQPEESPARNTPGLYARHHNRLRVQSMRARRQLPFQQAAAAHMAAAEAAAIARAEARATAAAPRAQAALTAAEKAAERVLMAAQKAAAQAATVAARVARAEAAAAKRADREVAMAASAPQQGLYPTDFLTKLEFSGVPPHAMHLREGCPVILLRSMTGSLAHGSSSPS